MLTAFTKPIDSLIPEDIQQLCEEQVLENDSVEFKRKLSGKSWTQDNLTISDTARNKILKEVVAFANAHGGHIIIGIDESEGKPSRAAGIYSVPRCTELAERLRIQARDCIEPRLPVFLTQGIVTKEDGSGVVVLRIPQSRLAPHRVKSTRICSYRRNDRSEVMSMREIQDLVLQRNLAFERLDRRFEKRRSLFYDKYTANNPSYQKELLFRITLIPTSTDLWLNDIKLTPSYDCFLIDLGGRVIRLDQPSLHLRSRPILGGIRCSNDDDTLKVIQEVKRDGLIEFVLKEKIMSEHDDGVHPGWFLGLTLNAMLTAHQFRLDAQVTNCEFGLETEIWRTNEDLKVSSFPKATRRLVTAHPNPLCFYRLSVGPKDEFNDVLGLLYRDLMNAAGLRPTNGIEEILWEET